MTVFADNIIVSLQFTLTLNCDIKFSVIHISGQFDDFAISGDLSLYFKARESIEAPIESITISFTKTPKTAMNMSGYLSPFEGIIHDTINNEIQRLMVSPNKIVINMTKEVENNERFKGRLKNLLIENYNKVLTNCTNCKKEKPKN